MISQRPLQAGYAKGQGRSGAASARAYVADFCYVSLKLTGWIMVTASCVIAAYALIFLMLGEFRMTGLVSHVDNFTSRYLAAEPVRQARFETSFMLLSAVLFTLIGFFRRHSLLPLNACNKEMDDDCR